MKKSISLRYIVLLQAAVILYTCTDIAAKLASRYPFLSMGFLLCYGVEILILGVYAICWQQIIKKVDISVAYSNRAFSPPLSVSVWHWFSLPDCANR